jgi:WD40 repeat protein
VASGSDDKTVRLWDFTPGEEVRTRTLVGHEARIVLLKFSSDGYSLRSWSLDNTVRTWVRQSGKQIESKKVPRKGFFYIPVVSADEKLILTGLVPCDDLPMFLGAKPVVLDIFGSKSAQLWNRESMELLREFRGHQYATLCATFSPDSRFAVTGSADNTARLWDVATGHELRVFKGHTGWVLSVAFSDDGKRILTGSADGTARLWEW